ncbi:MAG: MinD/ParA family protein [Candidatus Thermofonsia bacterium]|nr:MAG: MinD/ParA family protein [Candidatus Thermofonsia bacterium]
MSRIISVHSFRGGTGKSNSVANLSALMAAQGLRVAVLDTDIQSPGIHVLFGLDSGDIDKTLNDYLYDRCAIEEAAMDVTHRLNVAVNGRIFLIPSSIDPGDIAYVIRHGYDPAKLNDGFEDLLDALDLDVLLVDTHPGLNDETLLSIAVSDALVIILRPDQQDYQGTHVTVQVAKRLHVPQLRLFVNKVPPSLDIEDVRVQVAETYGCPVTAVLPHSDEMMALASSGIFALHFPEHPITQQLKTAVSDLLADS